VITEEDLDEKEIMIIPEEPEIKTNVMKMLKGQKDSKKQKSKKTTKSPVLQKSGSRIIKSGKSPIGEISKSIKQSLVKPLFNA